MRLTLRTLLAYLDDTLEPHEIKEIGQKVAESDAAQELIARIKQVTRRRRLTTPPPTGPGAKFDANTIAEYLDNELSGDMVAELEKTCLESDVHLAEVASCHQILTLVLGEPALVPPTARERMYGLVKGREAIPFRKARGRDGAAAGEGDDQGAEDPLLPGLPASRGWLLWALPVAAVLVLAALGVAIWQALPETRPPAVAAKPNNTQPSPADPNAGPDKSAPSGPGETPVKKTWTGKAVKAEAGKLTVKDADGKEVVLAAPAAAHVTIDGKEGKLENIYPDSPVTVAQVGDDVTGVDAVTPERTWTGTATKIEAGKLTVKDADGKETVVAVPPSARVAVAGKEAKLEDVSPQSAITVVQVGDAVTRVEATPATDERPAPPSTVRASAGRYVPPSSHDPTILVQRQAGQPAWKRLVPGGTEVFSTDDLVSLPGYNSELALGADGGTHLVLHGHVPQFTVHPYEILDFLLDSAVKLNQPSAGFDADVTLLRGRIYLSNRKDQGTCKVRLRFAGEVWDLTLLQPGTEAGVDLLEGYTGDINYRAGEAPLEEVYLEMLSGRADVRIDSREFADKPAPFVVHWDNGAGAGASQPQPVPQQAMQAVQAVWSKSPPAGGTEQERASIQEMVGALDGLAMLMTNRAVDAALLQARDTADNPALRVLAVYSFGAIDGVDKVLDVLCSDEDPAHAPDRSAAVFTIRRWLSRGADGGPKLYDEKSGNGLLTAHYHLRGIEARDVLTMLYDFPSKDAYEKATFEKLTSLLRSPVLAVRELAYWHLRVLSAGARVALPPYNAAWKPDERELAADAWKALIDKKDLPPARMP